MIPTTARMNEVKLEVINKPLHLQLVSMLRDQKVSTMPSNVATVGTTSILVLGSQSNRAFTQIVNISDSDVFLAFGETAVINHGAKMVADGGVYTIDWENMWKGAINGITSGANKNVSTVDGRVD